MPTPIEVEYPTRHGLLTLQSILCVTTSSTFVFAISVVTSCGFVMNVRRKARAQTVILLIAQLNLPSGLNTSFPNVETSRFNVQIY